MGSTPYAQALQAGRQTEQTEILRPQECNQILHDKIYRVRCVMIQRTVDGYELEKELTCAMASTDC